MTIINKIEKPLADYNPDVFSALSHFEKVKENNVDRLDIIRELGNIICKHKLQEKIGVCLLHQHFEISPEERLVRRVIGSQAYTQPMITDVSNLISYMWKVELGNGDSSDIIYPLEFININPRGKLEKQITLINHTVCSNIQFQLEFIKAVKTFDVGSIFGYSILNRCFLKRKLNETFLEITDEKERVLNLSPTSTIGHYASLIQTQWQFTFNGKVNFSQCSHCSHTDGSCYHR